MNRLLSRTTILLAAVAMTACSSWQPRIGTARDALMDPDARHVRVTRTNNERLEVRVAEIQGDSIYGTRGGSGPVTCTEASSFCNVQLPISEVGFVEVRSFSAIKTASLFVVPAAVLAIVFLVDEPCSPLDGPC